MKVSLTLELRRRRCSRSRSVVKLSGVLTVRPANTEDCEKATGDDSGEQNS
jgi:hypothetical protein